MERAEGRIELTDVSFRYGNREVNKGINLVIAPGEMIGLVGHSGSGKSTLVNLICRFYDVSEGAILLDGVDIRSFAISDYRRNIGLVLQEPFLFFGTIAQNIPYGKPPPAAARTTPPARARPHFGTGPTPPVPSEATPTHSPACSRSTRSEWAKPAPRTSPISESIGTTTHSRSWAREPSQPSCLSRPGPPTPSSSPARIG